MLGVFFFFFFAFILLHKLLSYLLLKDIGLLVSLKLLSFHLEIDIMHVKNTDSHIHVRNWFLWVIAVERII